MYLADGYIVEGRAAEPLSIDCRGYHVLPGIVDVHGDAFEVELHPRPGVEMDFQIGMRSVDRQLVANGITTAFHGLSVSWEPGTRSLAAARTFMEKLDGLRPSLMANHHVQLRWETCAHDSIDDIVRWLSTAPVPAIAFNDHVTETLEMMQVGDDRTLDKWARRAGVTLKEYVAEAKSAENRLSAVQQKVREVAGLARQRGVVMLAHDENTPEQRRLHRNLGCRSANSPLRRRLLPMPLPITNTW